MKTLGEVQPEELDEMSDLVIDLHIIMQMLQNLRLDEDGDINPVILDVLRKIWAATISGYKLGTD